MMDDVMQTFKDLADTYIGDILIGTQEVENEDILQTHDRDVLGVLELLGNWELVCDIKKSICSSKKRCNSVDTL